MTKLILFSGGVESAALLTLADKQDKLFMVEPFHGPEVVFFHKAKAIELAAYFGLGILSAQFKLPTKLRPIQMWALSRMASLMVSNTSEYTEVWWGRNTTDIRPDQVSDHNRIEESWKVAHPTVPLVWPLKHLSKKQQWDLIPTEVQHLVHSCIHVNPCGVCGKCQERIKHGIPIL